MGVNQASPNGGEIVARVLKAHGVAFLYTLCGGHISPILIEAKNHGIRIMDVRHEANAVFAADATSRISNALGVAAVTAGPGITNTITALQNAKLAQSPLVLLGGAAPTLLQGKGALQDIDQMALIKPNVKWAGTVKQVNQIESKLRQAIRQAQCGVPGPVFLELAIDLLYDENLIRDWHKKVTDDKRTLKKKATSWFVRRHLNKVFAPAKLVKSTAEQIRFQNHSASDLSIAAKAIHEAQRPLLLVGSGALMQSDKVDELAEAIKKLNIPTYLSGMARGLLGQDCNIQFRHKRRMALKAADLVMLAGVPCDFRLDYGSHIGSAKLIGINRSKTDLTKNRKPDLAVLADPTEFILELAGNAQAADLAVWLKELDEREQAREEEINDQNTKPEKGINPVSLFKKLESFAGKEAVFVADGGDFVGTSSYILKPRKPLSWLDPGVFGTLGVGGGFALAAKTCNPKAEVYIIYGDGSSAYSLMEFDTFQRLGIPVTAIIGNDGSWNQIARDQIDLLKDDVGTVLAQSDYQDVGKAFSANGLRVETIEEFAEALKKAKAANAKGQSFLINAILSKSDFRKGSISM